MKGEIVNQISFNDLVVTTYKNSSIVDGARREFLNLVIAKRFLKKNGKYGYSQILKEKDLVSVVNVCEKYLKYLAEQ